MKSKETSYLSLILSAASLLLSLSALRRLRRIEGTTGSSGLTVAELEEQVGRLEASRRSLAGAVAAGGGTVTAAEGGPVSPELDRLKSQVEANRSVEASAATLIRGLADKLAAAKDDPAAVQALSDELKASAADLGDAVAANT